MTKSNEITLFQVDHVTFRVTVRPADRITTYALIPGEALHEKDRRPLFTGTVGPDMADQLRALARHLDALCFERRRDMAKDRAE